MLPPLLPPPSINHPPSGRGLMRMRSTNAHSPELRNHTSLEGYLHQSRSRVRTSAVFPVLPSSDRPTSEAPCATEPRWSTVCNRSERNWCRPSRVTPTGCTRPPATCCPSSADT
eukprot:9359945-Pyramimonas_sp.AAC.1